MMITNSYYYSTEIGVGRVGKLKYQELVKVRRVAGCHRWILWTIGDLTEIPPIQCSFPKDPFSLKHPNSDLQGHEISLKVLTHHLEKDRWISFHLCSTALTEEKSKCSRCQAKMNILLYSLTRDKWETPKAASWLPEHTKEIHHGWWWQINHRGHPSCLWVVGVRGVAWSLSLRSLKEYIFKPWKIYFMSFFSLHEVWRLSSMKAIGFCYIFLNKMSM